MNLGFWFGSCENGRVLTQESFCESQEQCAITTSSATALKSNCTCISNNFCPLSRLSSKICMDQVSVSTEDYCFKRFEDFVWPCPIATKSLEFEQCYNE